MNLTLINQAFLALMHEFDRVLDRQDVGVVIRIDVIDHRRQRGRFARAGWPRNQDNAAWVTGDILEKLGATQVLKGQDFRWNGSEHRRRTPILVEGVNAKSSQPRQFKGKIALQKLLVITTLIVIHDVIDQALNFLGVQRRHVNTANIAIDTDHGRQTRREMQVGRFVFD